MLEAESAVDEAHLVAGSKTKANYTKLPIPPFMLKGAQRS